VLSGGDVAGEGEHKCMDWIRGWKQSKEFDINETHCIYGNDADLIFLSLALHIPKLIILREIPVYSNDNPIKSGAKRSLAPTEYEIVFISLVREYMEIEFSSIRDKLSFAVDIEKIVDDFILIAFFIGNDFLHQLYCMNAKDGNFDEIISIYKSTLAQLPGYINDKGAIQWDRFLVLLQKISKLELTMIGTTYSSFTTDLMASTSRCATSRRKPSSSSSPRTRRTSRRRAATTRSPSRRRRRTRRRNPRTPKVVPPHAEPDPFEDPLPEAVPPEDTMQEKPVTAGTGEAPERPEKPVVSFETVDPEPGESKPEPSLPPVEPKYTFEKEAIKKYFKMKDLVRFISSVHATFKKGDEEEIVGKKAEFYQRYFGMQAMERLDEVCLEYLKGIDFVINYYFKGCPSWTWAFKYNMSPFLSDLCRCLEKHVANIQHTFDKDEPLLPFHQMAYLLPKDSLTLLPAPLAHELRTNPKVSRFYPEVLDMFEPFDAIKEYQWIAKLEEFDELALREVVHGVNQSLYTEKERKRNTPGHNMVYKYNKDAPILAVKSKIPGFTDFEANIQISHLDIPKSYPYEHSKSNYDMKGLDNSNWPSLYQLEGIQGKFERIDRKSPVVRLELIYTAKATAELKMHQGKVYYDYPFKQVGDINSVITKDGVQLMKGGLPGELEEELSKRKDIENGPYTKYMKESVNRLYKRKVIDYQEGESEEPLYVVQGKKAGYRTCSDSYGKLIFDHHHYDILPHQILLQANGQVHQSQLVFPSYEDDMFKPGYSCVSLETGDTCVITDDSSDTHLTVDVLIPNSMKVGFTGDWLSLVDNTWFKIDKPFLDELKVQSEEVLALYALMDSFVVNVEQTKTTAMVLGGGFDIGLQMMKAINTMQGELQVVADLVRLVKSERTEYSLLVREDRHAIDFIAYDVYVSARAKNIIKEYVEKFEDIFGYLKGDVCFYLDRYALPAQHDVKLVDADLESIQKRRL
jgi:hypothetical protein